MALLFAACSGPSQPIVRLGQALQRFPQLDPAAQQAFVDSLRPELEACLAVMGRGAATVENAQWLSQTRPQRVFQQDVDSMFPTLSHLERQLGIILKNADAKGLDLPPLRFATLSWGYNQAVVRVDSVVLIALNHYLGEDYPGYSHWQAYVRQQKTPAILPYNIAEALVRTQYPPDFGTADVPLVCRMLYEGAVVEAVMATVPDACLCRALGYNTREFEFAEAHASEIWEEMALRRMIYDIDPVAADRLLHPAPSSPLMQGQAPGRIGRYIGYLIVRQYMASHPGTTLPMLLSPAFYSSTQSLIQSGFN